MRPHKSGHRNRPATDQEQHEAINRVITRGPRISPKPCGNNDTQEADEICAAIMLILQRLNHTR